MSTEYGHSSNSVLCVSTVLLDHWELCEGNRREFQSVGKRDDLHSTWALGGVVLQTLGHLFLFCKHQNTNSMKNHYLCPAPWPGITPRQLQHKGFWKQTRKPERMCFLFWYKGMGNGWWVRCSAGSKESSGLWGKFQLLLYHQYLLREHYCSTSQIICFRSAGFNCVHQWKGHWQRKINLEHYNPFTRAHLEIAFFSF